MSQNVESGSKRAAEVTEAMLGMPGYADDSMFFVVRYGDKVKNTLRRCDWEDFEKTLGQISDVWIKSGGGGNTPQPGSSVEERYAKSVELRAHALGLLEGFPDLVRDFDRFVAASPDGRGGDPALWVEEVVVGLAKGVAKSRTLAGGVACSCAKVLRCKLDLDFDLHCITIGPRFWIKHVRGYYFL